MKDEDAAQVGDSATVMFVNGDRLLGVIKYKPGATGDSWVMHCDDGKIVHFQMFETITVTNRRIGVSDEDTRH